MLSFNPTMMLLGACCAVLMTGYAWNEKPWGPWAMLVGVVGLLLLIATGIINLMSGH